MSKIDPGLKRLARPASGFERPGVRGFFLTAGRFIGLIPPLRANVMVELDGGTVPEPLLALGFQLQTKAGNVVTGHIGQDRILQLEQIGGLKRAEAPRPLLRELDLAVPAAGVRRAKSPAPPSARGANAIVAIIDHGIDYRHPSFQHADGTTRILAIWDQALDPVNETERPPDGFDYGVEYTVETIDRALRGEPGLIRHRDRHPYHGTHVAGIAAGNGEGLRADGSRVATPRIGMAPDADMIVVATTRPRPSDPGSMGDSADMLDGIAYVLRKAEELRRPVAINLSQGDNIGPHDGTSLLEVGIGNLIAGPGRVLIKSAGNEGAKLRHAQGQVSPGEPNELRIRIPAREVEIVVDIWYPKDDRLDVQIVLPDGQRSRVFGRPFDARVTLPNGTVVDVDADTDPGNGDNRAFIALRLAPGSADVDATWTLRLTGTGSWHAWIQHNSRATFEPPFVNAGCTVSIPGTTPAVICVGSHISRTALEEVGALSSFSSRGPLRTRALGPTVTAPGERIWSAQPDGNFIDFEGTSQAAAVVTGAAALLLSVDPTLTAADIRDCLARTARQDAKTGPVPNDRWGHGKLDVAAALAFVKSR